MRYLSRTEAAPPLGPGRAQATSATAPESWISRSVRGFGQITQHPRFLAVEQTKTVAASPKDQETRWPSARCRNRACGGRRPPGAPSPPGGVEGDRHASRRGLSTSALGSLRPAAASSVL